VKFFFKGKEQKFFSFPMEPP